MDNKLLARLPPAELKLIQPHLQPVELRYGQVLAEPDEPIRDMHFPTQGVLSMVNEPEDGDVIEFATVGNEGMAGVPLLLGASTMPSRVFVQVGGSGFRGEASRLLDVLKETPTFHARLMRYVLALFNQVAQGASCNRLHDVQERCARWLLHTHDRVNGESFTLTQEFLSQMLGVHRPTVTIAARMLQQAGLIRYSRGHIEVIDRPGLEAASCPCYRLISDQYARLQNET
ncbi:Crp/Fnr family transcriptional regulator [Bradyrhizobium guangdongense]